MKILEKLNPSNFEIIVRTHARVPYSCPRLMIGHFKEVGLSMTLENIVKLERPIFSDVIARPLIGWLLYSFLTQIFLQWEVQKKEYRLSLIHI